MKIIIDAGHGPETPGKRSPDGRLREFHFNSAVAEAVKKRLVLDGHSVIFSHQKEADVPLHERTHLANRLKAELFISIHANAFGSAFNSSCGIECFTYTKPSAAAKTLAASLQNALVLATGRPDRGVKGADFAVLRDTSMPAVLIECGFMTNRIELELLKSENYRTSCAGAIVFAINCYQTALHSRRKA
ncbi:Sporulation-specific N-acetylmuramoyl-L-alanine amidase [Planococcus massiliensis]|uniref:Sporulation-specific N-acetylmuramoyl-L-alanine amidase n=1 Tax=Planococcus massiliensis TaxID=1499687 RepID=A0A098EQ85_9BACL|nr:N-acetylmuramoyl-L-alanine amidase [Planococcus massiliensis]CEG23461.1 Sporulation-specific N-acetylmuramoyl-L-alanine amidase [Planococcus massiliensis]